MARDINMQQITNHVIYLYNQLTETSDKCNFKQNHVLGGKYTVQLDCALTALLTANMRLLRHVAPLLTNSKKNHLYKVNIYEPSMFLIVNCTFTCNLKTK